MAKQQDVTGQRFGRLTVVEDLGRYKKDGHSQAQHWFRCVCDCGNEHITTIKSLRCGNVKSCGCLVIDSQYETHKKYNEYYIYNDIVFVKYSNCNEYFLCDLDDWNELKTYCWYKDGKGYARSKINRKITTFHRLIMGVSDNAEVDHIYQVRNEICDNRKNNLRVVTKQQNAMNRLTRVDNTSGYAGVYFEKNRGKWVATIGVKMKRIHLGTFNDKEEAIKARKNAEEKYFIFT